MGFVAHGGDGGIANSHREVVGRGFRIFRADMIDSVIIIGIAQMNFVGSNSNNGACARIY